MTSWKNDDVFKRFIGKWELDPGMETEQERENLEKYLDAICMYIALHIPESIFPLT